MEQPKKRNTIVVWLLLLAACIVAFWLLNSDRGLPFRQFYEFARDAGAGRVEEVRVVGNRITVTLRGTGEEYYTLGALGEEMIASLSEQGVPVHQGEEPDFVKWPLMVLAMVIALILVLWFLARRARGIPTDVFSFTKSRARIIPDAGKVTFADVGGCEEAKRLLGDVIDFLRDPQRWAQAGVRVPRGVLLEGPPGCGKTLLARGVAGETNARFYLACASEFVEVFVGVGAARVRDTFEVARKNAPAVIFVDELDAVGRLQALRIHTRDKCLAPEVSLERVAERTEGFNGAQLENLANEAAVAAIRRVPATDGQRPEVRMEDFFEALPGTETADPLDVVPDPWAGRQSGTV